MFMLTSFIESEFRFPGISISGIDALIHEALGSFSFTLNSIFDETVFSAAIATTPKSTKTDVAAIKISFLSFMCCRVMRFN